MHLGIETARIEDTLIPLNSAQRPAGVSTAWAYIFTSTDTEWIAFAARPSRYRNKANKLVLRFRDAGITSAASVSLTITASLRCFDETNTDGYFTWNKIISATTTLTFANTGNSVLAEFDCPELDKEEIMIKVDVTPAAGDNIYLAQAYLIARG